MGEVKEYRKKHWVLDLDADLASVPNPGLGDTVLTKDKKKLYYWQGGAWKTGLGYEFVPRSVAALDFNEGAFTTDGNWKVDGLDLSGIVPAGAVAVALNVYVSDDAANSTFQFQQDATNKYNSIIVVTQVAGIPIQHSEVIVINSDRLLDYKGSNLAFASINVTVVGWFI